MRFSPKPQNVLLIVTLDGVIEHVFGNTSKIMGWDPKVLRGKPLLDIIPHQYREAHKHGWAQFRLSSRGAVFDRVLDLEVLCQDGSTRPVALQVFDYDAETERLYGSIGPRQD